MTQRLTKQNQLATVKIIYDMMEKFQEDLPGKYYVNLEQVKNSLKLLSSSISADLKEAQSSSQDKNPVPDLGNVPSGNGAGVSADVQP